MPEITRQLLRKRAEHNEGIISSLEEISLHQEELESINEVLGGTCRKLKILYLQNNIISKIENLQHLKDLQYLNLALNNITKIEGLSNCEFLKKLDLTVNFIDFDSLKESIEHLQSLKNLDNLYLMGNPSQSNWEKFNFYVIAKLPQLNSLDGTEITRSMRIQAQQQLLQLEMELEKLAIQVKINKEEKLRDEPKKLKSGKDTAKYSSASIEKKDSVHVEDVDEDEEHGISDPNEMTDNTPEARVEIYKELAAQKKEKEDRERANLPRERNYEQEQKESIEKIRQLEEEQDEQVIKQKNEGGWEFLWDEESKPGFVILDVKIQKHLDSSLIDVDVHPTYLSIIIKSKILRLRLPAEVKVVESKCQRSKLTGSLMIIMPKVNPNENAITIRGDKKARAQQELEKRKQQAGNRVSTSIGTRSCTVTSSKPKKLTLQEQMLADAARIAAGEDPAKVAADNRNDGTGGKDALLDKNIGKGSAASANRIDVGGIVQKKTPATKETKAGDTVEVHTTPLVRPVASAKESLAHISDDLEATSATVFRTSGRVIELE